MYAEWSLWSTTARVVTTRPSRLGAAREVCEGILEEVDRAANRFDPTSELRRLRGDGAPTPVSPLLAELVLEARAAAERTGGALDPTVGSALDALGYDRDIRLVLREGAPPLGCGCPSSAVASDGMRDAWQGGGGRRGGATTTDDNAVQAPAGRCAAGHGMGSHTPIARLARVPGWRRIHLAGDRLFLPPGTQLDLGATAKASAADRCARAVHRELGVGVLVSLGGDLATAGPAPHVGWQVVVQGDPLDPPHRVTLGAGSALATSSTRLRRWEQDGAPRHHLIDPATAQPAEEVWRTASVVAGRCLDANTAATAAIVKGERAVGWLQRLGLAARLVDADGAVHLVGSWPRAAAA